MKSIVKKLSAVAVIAAFALTASIAMAAPQANCPVMGNPIDKSLYADHNGKRVYFCCQMCLPQFKKNPKAFIKKLESKGVELEKVTK